MKWPTLYSIHKISILLAGSMIPLEFIALILVCVALTIPWLHKPDICPTFSLDELNYFIDSKYFLLIQIKTSNTVKTVVVNKKW